MDHKCNRKVEKIEEKFDPLNVLPEELLDNIFGYLDVKDLLNSSLVSWNWYNTIGRSACIERINLVYNHEHAETDKMESLLKSNRQYQNIKINEIYLTTEREVKMKNIFEKFAGSIKFIETRIDIQRCCELPKLRKLNWNSRSCRSFYTNGLFSKMELIEDLAIGHHSWDEKFTKLYKDMFTSAKNLKVLKICHFYFPILKECKFKLRDLRCPGCKVETIEFLKMQSATLEVLHIGLSDNDAVDGTLSVILTMPNLNTLVLYALKSITIKKCLPVNRTIKYLDLYVSFTNNILTFLKNLQVLKVNGSVVKPDDLM